MASRYYLDADTTPSLKSRYAYVGLDETISFALGLVSRIDEGQIGIYKTHLGDGFKGYAMGFHRQSHPAALDRPAGAEIVPRFVAGEIAAANADRDPFGLDHDCLNPAGHTFIGSCGDVACVHCARIAWQ
jgi:hypothetical protein